LCWRMSLSANRIPPPVKPEGRLRRDKRKRHLRDTVRFAALLKLRASAVKDMERQ
jgi:hypothetical protein